MHTGLKVFVFLLALVVQVLILSRQALMDEGSTGEDAMSGAIWFWLLAAVFAAADVVWVAWFLLFAWW